MAFSPVKRERGKPRRTLKEVAKKDLMANNISKDLVSNRV